MNDDPRVQRARELLAGTIRADHESEEARSTIRDLLDVVGELQQWKSEAADVMIGLQDLGKALDVPFGKRITGEAGVEAATKLRERAEAAEAERDRLQAAVERVTEMCRDTGNSSTGPTYALCADVMAALNGEG